MRPLKLGSREAKDCDSSRAAIEYFLESFVSAALGLSLEARIQDARKLPAGHRGCLTDSQNKPAVWLAWKTNQGPVSVCAEYENDQSRRMRAHVLWLAWWIAAREHHEGWWHCYPKRPREWIKGPGTQSL